MSNSPGHPLPDTERLALACHDVMARPRQLTLTVRAGQVIVQTPPGQVAVRPRRRGAAGRGSSARLRCHHDRHSQRHRSPGHPVTALRTAAAAVIRAAAAAGPQIWRPHAGTVTGHRDSAHLDSARGGRLIRPTR